MSCIFLLCLVPFFDTPAEKAFAAKVDAAVAAEMTRQEAVGCAFGILRDGKVVYLKGHGWADREKKVPVTTDTLFRWASISKTITAVAAMQLVEQGKLDLDQDVRFYVPEFPDKGHKLTVRQVLCHQAGIVHYINGKVIKTQREYSTPHPYEDVVLALDTFKDSPLVATPGEKYSYSTHGYILASAIVERAGKQKFADQVAARICKPLGLTTLQPDYQWIDLPHRAVGYLRRNKEIVPSTNTDVSWKLGGGGFISSIEDMAKYAQGLLDHKLCSTATERLMWEAQKTARGELTKYGLGFGVEKTPEGRPRVSHSGSQEKTKTMMILYPKERTAYVFMTNSEQVNPGDFTLRVAKAVE